ncbi:MAG TPA: aspartate--tRNA ligase [Candidatus Pacearchaeota archaeon]|nr:aspartate--tRNA ligase [Candidatus Pacearchaeota archaeon]
MKRILSNEIINYIGKEVKVCGWVNSIRVHGKIIFIDLRDISGILQVVFDYKNQEIYKIAEKVKPESVIELKGIINERPKNMINLKIKTGEVELLAKEIKILSKAETLPFSVEGDGYDINEEKRMKYRYLDLRRERMKRNLKTRFEVISFMRDFLKKEGFIEVETPILTKSTPEGARDFLVPSRLEKGKFYALPQSPQQYKQLLMVAGLEKYFQIARCFRDEDPRADRQAEFTQLDIETSFYSQEEILDLIERLYISLVKELFPEKKIQKIPFPRLTYKEVMEKYNSDKPDLRMDKNSKDELAFAFIVDFPMFVWSEEEKRWDAVHHPFTRPQTDNIKEIKKNPENILAYQYDFVLNGYEIGGGSLRTYNPEVLEAVFEVMGHKKDEIKEKFGHLLKAFEYGVPPHGGIAPGIDRFLSIVLNEPNIREVIAFPKTGDSRDLMMGAPDKVDEKQLKELGLEIKDIKDKDKKDKKRKKKNK